MDHFSGLEFSMEETQLARSSMRNARVALARCLAIIMHVTMRDETEFQTIERRSRRIIRSDWHFPHAMTAVRTLLLSSLAV